MVQIVNDGFEAIASHLQHSTVTPAAALVILSALLSQPLQ